MTISIATRMKRIAAEIERRIAEMDRREQAEREQGGRD